MGKYSSSASSTTSSSLDPILVAEAQPEQIGFDNKLIRLAFIRKVFILVTLQLLVVVGLIALFKFEPHCKKAVQDYPWIYYISYVVFLVAYIAVMCCPKVRRSFPANLICLIILTLAMGYMTAMISSYHDTHILFLAFSVTVFSCAAIIIFASQTRFDFTKLLGVMFVIGITLFILAIAIIIIHFFIKIPLLFAIFSGLIALFFMVFLAIDVQMVMGNKTHAYQPGDYIAAAVHIFVDIVMIFQAILSIFSFAGK